MEPAVSARSVVMVASGKGGVGKSTVTLNMAALLARQGARVGVVDCDVYGPDIAVMTGVTRRVPVRQWTLARRGGLGAAAVRPVERFGVHIMSAGLLFGEEQSLSWPAGLIGVLLNQMLRSPSWPTLDHLLVDMPPGTADVTQTVLQQVPKAKAVVVVTPQEVAHLDARKLVSMLGTFGIEILGGVDNMAGFVCPCCGETSALFPPVATERSIWAAGVDHLGSIPLDPTPQDVDPGIPVVLSRPQSRQGTALRAVVEQIRRRIGPDRP